jgi:repressor LexA
MDTDLKPREIRVLKYMREEISQKGYPPTIRELCSYLKIKSTSTIFRDLNKLSKKGYIEKDPAKPRALMLTPEAYRLFGDDISGLNKAEEALVEKFAERLDVVDLPIVGSIAAGQPILSQDYIDDYMPIPAQYVRGECFVLKISGDSMIDAGIYDGDYVMIRRQATAHNGDIAAVAIDDGYETEATVKTFYYENGRVRLQPENENMEPIYPKNARIIGLVKGVFRYLG